MMEVVEVLVGVEVLGVVEVLVEVVEEVELTPPPPCS